MGIASNRHRPPAAAPAGRKPRARKRSKGAPTHVRSWPLRPNPSQCRDIRTRFFTGTRVYNAALGEFLARSRGVKSDPAWETARQMPRRTSAERTARRPRSARWRGARVHQRCGAVVRVRAAKVVGTRTPARAGGPEPGWPRVRCGQAVARRPKGQASVQAVVPWVAFVAAKDGQGALRPNVDAAGLLVGLQWGAGFVVPIAAPAQTGRRGKEQQAELAEIEALIAAGKVLSTRIVRTKINGRDTYRMQMVCDGYPTRRRPVGDGRVSFDLGPSEIAVAVERSDGTWTGWVQPLADGIRLDTARLRRTQRRLDRQHRAGSPDCFNPDGTHRPGRCTGSAPARPSGPRPGWPSCTAGWPSTARRCTGRWPTGCSATAPISPARSWITSHGRRTFRAVCGTGHRGCSWR